jgi:hypothetical protein
MRVFAVALISLLATSDAFAPTLHARHVSALGGTSNNNNDGGEPRTQLGQKMKRAGKGLKRGVAAVAFASLAFRQPRDAQASVEPISLVTGTEEQATSSSNKMVPVVTAAVGAAGVGTMAAKYVIKRGESEEMEEEVEEEVKAKESLSLKKTSKPDETPSSETAEPSAAKTSEPPAATSSDAPAAKVVEMQDVQTPEEKVKDLEKEKIVAVLEKVKAAEKKALEAKVKATPPPKKEEPAPVAALEKEVETKPAAVATLEPPKKVETPKPKPAPAPTPVAKKEPVAAVKPPQVKKEPKKEPVVEEDPAASFTSAEKLKIADNVFECHGFFPDLRPESELSSEVRKMRQQPKAAGELRVMKKKYEAIEDESERVYTMLVDLGMMESYDHLNEYTDDFDDEEL